MFFYGFRSGHSRRGLGRAVGGMPPIRHELATALGGGGIVMRSPAAKDPDLTSGLRAFNPGRARFQGNCVCFFLLACCLLVACFCLFFVLVLRFLFEPGGKAEKQSREAPLRVMFPLRLRYASVTLPLRFSHVSVAFPWCASPWPLPGASVKETSLREQSLRKPLSERDSKEIPCQRAMVKDVLF